MSSAGHVFDMLNRIKYNESLKHNRNDQYKKIKDAYQKKAKKHYLLTDKNSLSQEGLNRLKLKIRKDIIRQRRIINSIRVFFMIVITVGLGYLVYWLLF